MQILLAFCATSDILCTEYVSMSVLNMYPLIMIINAWVEDARIWAIGKMGERKTIMLVPAVAGNNWIPV